MTAQEAGTIREIANRVARLVPNAHDAAAAAVSENWSVERFQRSMLAAMPSAQPVFRPNEPEYPHEARSRFSVARLVSKLARGEHLDGLELEVSRECELKTGKTPQGTWVPFSLLNQRDNLFVTPTSGGNISPIQLDSEGYIDALRNQSVLIRAGVRVMPGMQGTVVLPRLETPAVITPKTEGVAYSTSTPVFSQITLTPRIIPSLVKFTKLLAVQSSPAVEQLVRDDLQKQTWVELERQVFHGSGSAGQIQGLHNFSGVTDLGTVAATAAYNRAVSLETLVAASNGDAAGANLAYITNAKTRAVLKQTPVHTVAGAAFAWTHDPRDPSQGVVNGTRAFCTNNVSSTLTTGTLTAAASALFYGNWSDSVLAFWGPAGLDLTVDVYSEPGWCRLSGQVYYDWSPRHAASFAFDDALAAG